MYVAVGCVFLKKQWTIPGLFIFIFVFSKQLTLKMGHPRPLFRSFSSFQTNITIFTTNKCEKCPSSILCWDSNPWPSEHESPPMTTRPRLPSAHKTLSSLAVIPIPLTAVWLITMVFDDDADSTHCGQGYSFLSSYWILEGPRIAVIMVMLLETS